MSSEEVQRAVDVLLSAVARLESGVNIQYALENSDYTSVPVLFRLIEESCRALNRLCVKKDQGLAKILSGPMKDGMGKKRVEAKKRHEQEEPDGQ